MSAALRRHRAALLGVAYVLTIAVLVSLSVATYAKALPWQRAVEVRLVTRDPGLELNPGSDVKIQGRLVGRVASIDSDGSQATVRLAIDPDEHHWVPADADAAIVPKTLFGEKYVDLMAPQGAMGARISDGAVIRQSRTAVELGAVYERLVPVLQALRPADLSVVLKSLAATLDGNGERLGRIIEQTNAFMGDLAPHLDSLDADLRTLAVTLQTYDRAAPDLLKTLGGAASISSELLVPKEKQLAGLLATLTSTSDQVDTVVRRNAQDIIALTGRSRPLLRLLDDYSSEIPCSLRGLHLLDKLGNQVTGGRAPWTLLNVDVLVQGDPYVYPQDLPSSPGSDANNANLPALVPSFAPHCPRFGLLQSQVQDAAAFSLSPEPANPVTSGSSRSGSTASSQAQSGASSSAQAPAAGSAGQMYDPRLSRALARELLTQNRRQATQQATALGGLLVGPMLFDGQAELP